MHAIFHCSQFISLNVKLHNLISNLYLEQICSKYSYSRLNCRYLSRNITTPLLRRSFRLREENRHKAKKMWSFVKKVNE